MRVLKIAGIGLLILVGLYLLWALLSFVAFRGDVDEATLTPAAAAETVDGKAAKRHAYRRAHRLYRHGHRHRAKRVLHRARIMRLRVSSKPLGRECPSGKRCWKQEAFKRSGSGHRRIHAGWVWRSRIGGFKLASVHFSQRFHWRRHRIRSVSRLRVPIDLTGWADFIGANDDGIGDRGHRWGRSCGGRHCHRHGMHYAKAERRVKQCLPLGPGCISLQHRSFDVGLYKWGNGAWYAAMSPYVGYVGQGRK